jgi:hypothetical protein
MLRRNMIWLPPVSAFGMYAVLQYLLNQYGKRFFTAVDWSTAAALLWLTLAELLLLFILSRVRKRIVNRIWKRAGLLLPDGSLYLYLYALCCWTAATVLLLRSLWQLAHDTGMAGYFQLWILSDGILVLMGIAIPWSAARFIALLWYRKKLSKFANLKMC